ncbi:MAG: valine--tRNA ligase [Chlamydiales bacterium]|nr:valine--tRNA ligase [Chlamydiales bacterium]
MAYEPKDVEEKWSRFWEGEGFFKADPKSSKPKFSIVMPPPNVTGSLHMGHALVSTLQDIIVRWKRMSGFETLWVPGTDHAGIATQTVVERHLIKTEGKRRIDYDRDDFVKKIWDWKEEHQDHILGQLKRVGCSCDWSRLRFTLDDGASKAVKTVFEQLQAQGLIYRGDYLVNWDPATQTALADDEVEYEDENSFLWHIRYPVEGTDESLVIATTRPETLLGDTAVAVAPNDPRYSHLVGKMVRLPLTDRFIPIIEDHHVDANFGTGALKITPAHDPNDYEIGLRHHLPMINIMTPDGKIAEGKYKGLSMGDARLSVEKDLGDLLVKKEPHAHRVGISYRSKAKIEPFLSKQWFFKLSAFKDQLMNAVKKGHVTLTPKSWEQTYFHWIENLRDWCISRQLWWGHRIPALVDGEPDPDVLDTWFSSALWPFSTLGWPDNTPEMEAFYPNSLLVTGHDILFFWVARMILMGEVVTGKLPFPQVFLHGLIYGKSYWRETENGVSYVSKEERQRYDLGEKLPKDVHSKWEKMSKSKGNVIDPIEMIDLYGTDAMRFALCASTTGLPQIDLDVRRFEEFKNFINKIYNGSRFVFMHLGQTLRLEGDLQLEDRWILSRLNRAIREANSHLETFAFDKLAMSLYDFFWNEFCAYYVEICKPALFAKQGHENKQTLLAVVLTHALAMMHPIAPFITEELFSEMKLNSSGDNPYVIATQKILDAKALIIAPYPQVIHDEDSEAEKQFEHVREIIYSIRNIRAEMQLPPSMATDIYFSEDMKPYEPIIRALVKCNQMHHACQGEGSKAKVGTLTIAIPLPEEMREKEKVRIEKEITKIKGQIDGLEKKLANPSFLERAPKELVDQTQTMLAEAQTKLKAYLGSSC